MTEETSDLRAITADIVAAHVANNRVTNDELPALIKSVFGALNDLGAPEAPVPAEKPEPAVSMRKSLANPNHIVSMIDGRNYTMLKRHLAQNGLTPAEYRERYDLPADYPMTAKAYSDRRRELAHSFGLGRKKDGAEAQAETAPEAPAKAEKAPRKARKSAVERLKDAKAAGPFADNNEG